MSTGSPMVAWAAPRSIAAWRMAQMITPIAAAMIAPATVTSKRRTATALMNESGTTTAATINMRFPAFSR
jgi:hypothetical protein